MKAGGATSGGESEAVIKLPQTQIATYFGYLNLAIPAPEELADAIWRREDFEPPRPPEEIVRR
jgi:hypothetical protein